MTDDGSRVSLSIERVEDEQMPARLCVVIDLNGDTACYDPAGARALAKLIMAAADLVEAG